jgi:hypothetical protein
MKDKISSFVEDNFTELSKVGIAIGLVILASIITLLIILIAP